MDVQTPILLTVNPLITAISCQSASCTTQKNISLTIDQSEKAKDVKKRKILESGYERQ